MTKATAPINPPNPKNFWRIDNDLNIPGFPSFRDLARPGRSRDKP
jgi:hypothetical protein